MKIDLIEIDTIINCDEDMETCRKGSKCSICNCNMELIDEHYNDDIHEYDIYECIFCYNIETRRL